MTATPTDTQAPRTPGANVRARGREWVVLQNSAPNTLKLRPLGGGEQQIATLSPPPEGREVTPATFPWPEPPMSSLATGARCFTTCWRTPGLW